MNLEEVYEAIQIDPAFDHLRKTGANFVPGTRSYPNPPLMFIGEAPGAQEDKRREPFVGAAGKILDNLLLELELTRDNVFVSNVLHYRPPANRDPVADEKKAAVRHLINEISTVKPRLIIPLGRHALTTFFPMQRISAVHGQLIEGRFVPLYHPATVIYDPSRKQMLVKDFRGLLEHLENSREWPDESAVRVPSESDHTGP